MRKLEVGKWGSGWSEGVEVADGQFVDRIGWKHTVGSLPDNPEHKLHRKNIASVAGSATARRVFDRAQEEESVHFLLRMLDTPEKLLEHVKTEAGTVILKMVYGYVPGREGRDPLVDLIGEVMDAVTEAAVPGKWWVDIVPVRKLGGCSFAFHSFSRMMRDAQHGSHSFFSKKGGF